MLQNSKRAAGSAVKNPPALQKTQETRVPSLGWEDPLEEGMATHSSILAWRIPWTERAWQAIVHGVAKNQTRLKQLNTLTEFNYIKFYLKELVLPLAHYTRSLDPMGSAQGMGQKVSFVHLGAQTLRGSDVL